MSDINAIPPLLSFASAANNPNMTNPVSVKPATPEIFLPEEQVSIELMTDLIFENIGGQELINISRTDLINGQNVIYQPIKNLTSLYFQYNPQNVLSLQNTSEEYFKKFPIKLSSKIPFCGNGPNCSFVYIDPSTGDLIIEVINMENDEQVEVQLLSGGNTFNDTIYEVN